MRNMKRLGIAMAIALLPLTSVTAEDGGDGGGPCYIPKEIPFSITSWIGVGGGAVPGTNVITCKTYFLGILVNTSTINCPDWKKTTPKHYHCTTIVNTLQKCVVGTGNVIISDQPMKGECEGATGLNVSIGGVEFGIDWWKAVCKNNGAPVLSIHAADSPLPCPKADGDETPEDDQDTGE